MEFQQHIETSIGDVWVIDAHYNDWFKLDSETRQSYEARVIQSVFQSIVGDVEMNHESNGAPVIDNRPDLHISISHSENWFAVYISEKKPVGIDIEIRSNQIDKTRSYFLSKTEIEAIGPSKRELQICWGVKESIFKMLRGNVKSMKNDIQIVLLDRGEARAKCQGQAIDLTHEQTDFFTLVYTE